MCCILFFSFLFKKNKEKEKGKLEPGRYWKEGRISIVYLQLVKGSDHCLWVGGL